MFWSVKSAVATGITPCKSFMEFSRPSRLLVERPRAQLTATIIPRHLQPIEEAAFNLLRSIPTDISSPYVFPATRGNRSYQGLRKVWISVCKQAEIADATMHTLRHRNVTGPLWRGVGKILKLFSKQECSNFFAASGYGDKPN